MGDILVKVFLPGIPYLTKFLMIVNLKIDYGALHFARKLKT